MWFMSTATTSLTALGPHLFWLISRSAGILALIASSLSVSLGLMMGGRFTRLKGPDLRVAHEALALTTLGAIAVHGLALLGDSYLHPSLAQIAIPFAASYKPLLTGLGIIAFWTMFALGAGYYLRRRIGVRRWRLLHRFTAVAWLMGLVHSLGMGTDAGQAWFLAMSAVVVLPALALLAIRIFGWPTAEQAPVRA